MHDVLQIHSNSDKLCFLILISTFFYSRLPTTTTTTKAPKRARPPFLRPIAKFTDIKIPALDKFNRNKNAQINKENVSIIKTVKKVVPTLQLKPRPFRPKLTENEEKDENEEENDKKSLKISLFNRPLRPNSNPKLNAILRNHRTSTTTTTTTTTIATTNPGKKNDF